LAWLWDSIQHIIGLFVNNNTEFRRLGGQTYNAQQRRILLEMPMPSLVGLTRGPIRQECTGVLIVYDCWQQLVVTAYPCTPRQKIPQPDEGDGWISSWSQPSSNCPFKGYTNISRRIVNRCVTINQRSF
jgi:hypothetical protein